MNIRTLALVVVASTAAYALHRWQRAEREKQQALAEVERLTAQNSERETIASKPSAEYYDYIRAMHLANGNFDLAEATDTELDAYDAMLEADLREYDAQLDAENEALMTDYQAWRNQNEPHAD